MTPQVDLGWGATGAAIGSLFTGAFAWLAQRKKGETDIEVAVLAEWQKLNGALSDRLAAVEKELSDVRRAHAAELEAIRRDHAREIDEMRRQHRVEMKAMREYTEGLERQIAQNSHSTAQLINRSKKDGE